ncbi:putative indole-3-acetic acid-amido synthetase GH3.1 [Capsicum annuum]|nr:putative indole-3-acetic acid-amido synthetase GH3.1 [Capsicum annuum]
MAEDEKSLNVTEESNPTRKHKGKHDKPKPWDDPSIDHWKIEKFDPEWNQSGLLEVSTFSTLFPQYRVIYLMPSDVKVPGLWRRSSPHRENMYICEIYFIVRGFGEMFSNIEKVAGSMTVLTTMKTRDPYIILKARDLIKLLSRSVFAPQAVKILNDEMQCDIIKIGSLVRNKGNIVAAMGSFKGLKQVRRIVEDCVLNKMHPLHHIKAPWPKLVTREINIDCAFTRVGLKLENVECLGDQGHSCANVRVRNESQLLPKLIPQNPTFLVQTPCAKSFPKEEVDYPDPHQGKKEIETSLVLDSELIKSEALASSKSVHEIDHALFRFDVLFEDDINTPNETSGENNGIACLEGYSRYAKSLWCDNIPPKNGNLFLEDESTLMGKECVVSKMSTLGVHDD